MMLFQTTKFDERTESNTRYAAIVFGISVFGGLALQLFLGGVLPALTWRGALAAYATLTSFVVAGCLLVYGWPQPAEWANTWLPALLGPALIVGAYALVARLGQWRIERQIEKLSLGNS